MIEILEQDMSKKEGEEYDFVGAYVAHGQLYSQGYTYCYSINQSLFFSKVALDEQVQGELEHYTHAEPILTQMKPSIKAWLEQKGIKITPTTKY
jgi:hypothetical protein